MSTITGAQVVSEAMQWLGVPYTYGGGRGTAASARLNGVDCSGLVYQVFSALGINPGTDTVSQFNNPAAVTVGNLSQAQPGDLIFFGQPTGGTQEHVGIYIGGGAMIDAPHTGATVRVDQVANFGETMLGIKRLTSAPGVSADSSSALGAAGSPSSGGSAVLTSSSSSITSTIERFFLTIVALGLALALVGLGVHAGVKTPKQEANG